MNIHIENDFTTNLFNDVQTLLYWKPIIEKTLKRYKSLYTFTSLVQMYLMGQFIFLYNDKAFALLTPSTRPLGSLVHIEIAGGSKEGLLELENDIIRFAKNIDACQITGLARKGFNKWPLSWKNTNQHWFIKEL